MKPTPQLPGQLPKGATLDALLTVEQFAVWVQQTPRTCRENLNITPGVIGNRSAARVHPRTYLEQKTGRKISA